MTTVKNLSDHRRAIIGARRRNNIYGEVTDFMVMELIGLGCDAAFYNPNNQTPVTMFAKTEHSLFVVKVLYQESQSPDVDHTEHVESLQTCASAVGAIPVFMVVKNYARSAKVMDIKGKKIVRMD